MLNVNDIDFLISGLDQLNIKGIQASLKLNEVFMKLSKMKELQAEAAARKENDEEREKEDVSS